MIFVTGGTGLLGNWIVRELCNRGERVRALCRQGTSREAFEGLDVEIVEGDLQSEEVLSAAIEGCKAVIHSAAYIHIGWANLQQSRDVNVGGTQRIAEACLAHGARLVHVSTVDTLPAAESIASPIDERGEGGVQKTHCSYVVSKREAEDVVWSFVREKNLDAVVVHPGFMLAPYDWKPSSGRMMLEVRRAPVVLAPRGGCSLCDARDVAVAVANSVTQGQTGENYILAGENLTYQHLWSQMLEASGRKRFVGKLLPGTFLIGWCIDTLITLTGKTEGDVNGAALAMGGLNHYYDSARAERELGYRRRPVKETLTDAWNWLAEHHVH